MMKQVYSNLLLLLTAAIWGFAFVAQSVGMDYIGPFAFQSIRSLIGAAVLVPVILLRDRQKKQVGTPYCPTPEQRKKLLLGGLLCGTALCVASCFQQIGIQYTTTAKAGFLTAMYLILVPIFAIPLGRKPALRIWLCVALAAVGIYFLSITDSLTISGGDALVIICAVCFAVQILLIDHFAPGLDGVRLSCIQFFVSGVLSGIPALLFEHTTTAMLLAAWAPILYAGALSCGVAYTLQVIGQQHAEPTTATLIMSLESVFSLIGGMVILRQIPSARELFGCILVFCAVILAQIPIKKLQTAQQQS